jgi:serine phosphatase RsbU (regulator of sigma subunit)
VVLYTDGVVERRGAAIDEGIDRLLGAVRGAAAAPAPLSCDVVLETCLPRSQADDAVLVVIEFDRPAHR